MCGKKGQNTPKINATSMEVFVMCEKKGHIAISLLWINFKNENEFIIILYIKIILSCTVCPCVGVCGCAISHWNRISPHMNV